MPKARNRRQRTKQIEGWLRDEYPVGRTIEVIWVAEVPDVDPETGKKHQCYGQTYRDVRELVIEISERRCRTWELAADTLIHEWAHAVLWGPASIEDHAKVDDHGAAWRALYGEIINRWHHDHGHEQADEYPVE